MSEVRPHKKTLVLGGARSGKSSFAESLTEGYEHALYVATALNSESDPEMEDRIAIHMSRRGEKWKTIEEPINIADVIKNESSYDRPILVDCLTIWVSNLMYAGLSIENELNRLTNLLRTDLGAVTLVSSEVGSGIVPLEAISREFRDNMGIVNQAIAIECDRVALVVAGLSIFIKDE